MSENKTFLAEMFGKPVCFFFQRFANFISFKKQIAQ